MHVLSIDLLKLSINALLILSDDSDAGEWQGSDLVKLTLLPIDNTLLCTHNHQRIHHRRSCITSNARVLITPTKTECCGDEKVYGSHGRYGNKLKLEYLNVYVH